MLNVWPIKPAHPDFAAIRALLAGHPRSDVDTSRERVDYRPGRAVPEFASSVRLRQVNQRYRAWDRSATMQAAKSPTMEHQGIEPKSRPLDFERQAHS